MAVLKQRFAQLVSGVEASEIASMEQALMDEGLPAEEIKRLCDVHVEIFKEALRGAGPAGASSGTSHPHLYEREPGFRESHE